MHGWLIAFGVLSAILLFLILAEIRINISFREGQLSLEIRFCGIKVYSPKKDKQEKKKEPQIEPSEKKSLDDIKALLQPIAHAANSLRKKLLLQNTSLKIAVATDDAAKTAVMFGGVSALVGTFYGFLKNCFRLKDEHFDVYPDFQAVKTEFLFSTSICLRLIDGMIIGIVFLLQWKRKQHKLS